MARTAHKRQKARKSKKYWWCFYGDVWGFRTLTAKRPEETFKALQRLHDDIASHKSLAKDARTFLLSDSIFICCPINKAAKTARELARPFEDLVTLIEFLITRFWEEGLPLRGAITLGEIDTAGNVLLGQPVIEAVTLEQQSVLAPIIVVPYSTLRAAVNIYAVLPPNYLKEQEPHIIDIPTKDGIMSVIPLLGDKVSFVEKKLRGLYKEATRGESPHAKSAKILDDALKVLKLIEAQGSDQ